MTQTAPLDRSAVAVPLRVSRAIIHSPFTLGLAFVLVQAWLGFLNLAGPANPMGDVSVVYHFWVDQALVNDFWVGIDSRWVYPIVAFVPMLGAMLLGAQNYALTWILMVGALNLAALGVLTSWGRDRSRLRLGWWWLLFMLVLGPIALGRIDSVSVPLALIAVLILGSYPRVATVLLTTATWIKVWPAAVLAAIVVTVRARVRVVVTAAAVSAAIVGLVALNGGVGYLLSFVTEQSARGLQVEAPVSTLWLWLAAAGLPGTFVYYDQSILTFQVQGPGVDVAAAVMTPLLALVTLAVCALALVALRKGHRADALLSPLMLALVSAFIVVNKVGSPQFESWLAVPVIFGLIAARRGAPTFRFAAIVALILAALTQLIYPYGYAYLLALDPLLLIALSARNIFLVVLLGWALAHLVRLAFGPRTFDDEVAPASDSEILVP